MSDASARFANDLIMPSSRSIAHPAVGIPRKRLIASTYRTPNTLDIAWAKCLEVAGIDKRFTPHGLRYTFTDLVRRANVDAVVRRALTGHVTEEMQRHYSTVGIDEKRAAIFRRALHPTPPPKVGVLVGVCGKIRGPEMKRPIETILNWP